MAIQEGQDALLSRGPLAVVTAMNPVNVNVAINRLQLELAYVINLPT
jgi:hypothetical protein